MTRRALLILPVLLALLVPASATASSAYVDAYHGTVVFSAGAGETNNVTVSHGTSSYTVTDSGSTISPGTGCAKITAGQVTCTGTVGYVYVSSGDMNDSVTSTTSISSYLDGGAGSDVLRGGAGRDWLFGNSGDDVLDGGASGDSLSGGDGTDRVDYSTRSAAVHVTLDGTTNDGESNEGDNVSTTVEAVTGGSGADTLTGNTGPNVLRGGPGADTIDGGLGADVIDGGDGADSLLAKDGVVDQITCGSGSDTVAADPTDSLSPDCSKSGTPASPTPTTGPVLELPASVRLTPQGSIHVRVRCAAGSTCRGRIKVELLRGNAGGASASAVSASSKRKHGRRFNVKAGKSKVVAVHISRNGRRRVLAQRKAKCRVSMVFGGHVTSSKVVTVKAPKSRR